MKINQSGSPNIIIDITLGLATNNNESIENLLFPILLTFPIASKGTAFNARMSLISLAFALFSLSLSPRDLSLEILPIL